ALAALVQRRRGDDEAAVPAHVETGSEALLRVVSHQDTGMLEEEMPSAATRASLDGSGQLAVFALELGERFLSPRIHVDHHDPGSRAGDDPDVSRCPIRPRLRRELTLRPPRHRRVLAG